MEGDLKHFLKEVQQDDLWHRKLILGIVLSFIPLVNLLALGYLFRFIGDSLKSKQWRLPEWNDFGTLCIEGLWFLWALALGGFVVVGLGFLFSLAFGVLHLSFLGWIPLLLSYLVAPALVLCGLISIHTHRRLSQPFTDFKAHVHFVWKNKVEFLFPTLMFLGCITLVSPSSSGSPIYGIAFFLGFLGFIIYTLPILFKR